MDFPPSKKKKKKPWVGAAHGIKRIDYMVALISNFIIDYVVH